MAAKMDNTGHHGVSDMTNTFLPLKEGENEASSAETSLSVEDSAQHGRPAEAEAATDHQMVVPAEELQTVLAQKIARMEGKKNEDKDDEKYLTKLYKKTVKELKEQLDLLGNDEKVKLLHEKFCEKSSEYTKLERSHEKLQRQYDTLQREVENATLELTRTKTIKTKLEALCKQVSIIVPNITLLCVM
jgi:ABC-type phosphate transport system auxiliary subunit